MYKISVYIIPEVRVQVGALIVDGVVVGIQLLPSLQSDLQNGKLFLSINITYEFSDIRLNTKFKSDLIFVKHIRSDVWLHILLDIRYPVYHNGRISGK